MTNTRAKIQLLRNQMAKANVDVLALAPGTHMQWLLGFMPHPDERPCLLFVSQTHINFVMPQLNAQDVRQHCDFDFHEWSDTQGPDAALQSALQQLGSIQTIAIDDTMRADHAGLIYGACPDATVQFANSVMGPLRMRKDASEIELLKMNAAIADAAHMALRNNLDTSLTERQVVNIARDAFDSQGATIAFGIVGCGVNGSYPHHQSGQTRIAANQPIVVDIGARKDGYVSDITRMTSLGPVSSEYYDVHAVVESAVQAALNVIRPGIRACEVDNAARGAITDGGYGPYFTHRTGHGLGIDIHEGPYITAENQVVLETGMVFTVEPGIYLPNQFGIRLEEVVVVTDDGCEVLSQLPRELHVVGHG